MLTKKDQDQIISKLKITIEKFLENTLKGSTDEKEQTEWFNQASSFFVEIQKHNIVCSEIKTEDIACANEWEKIYKGLIEVVINSKQPIHLIASIFMSGPRFPLQSYLELLNLLATMVKDTLNTNLESLSSENKSRIETLIALTVYLVRFRPAVKQEFQRVSEVKELLNELSKLMKQYLSKVDPLSVSEDFLANIGKRNSLYLHLVSEIKEYEVGLVYQQITAQKRPPTYFKKIEICSIACETAEMQRSLNPNYQEEIAPINRSEYSPLERKSLHKSILMQTISLFEKFFLEKPERLEALFANRSLSLTQALIANSKYQEWLISLLCRIPVNSRLFYMASAELDENYIASLCKKWSEQEPEKLKNFFENRNDNKLCLAKLDNKLSLNYKEGLSAVLF